MKAEGKIVRPYIGVRMLQLTAENAAQMHKKNSQFPSTIRGVLLANIRAGSPAARAGLRQGDIITGML